MNKIMSAIISVGMIGNAFASEPESNKYLELEKKIERVENKSSWTDDVKISGFGSFGIGKSNNKAGYAFYTDERADTNIDSILGIQFEFNINNNAKIITQISASGRYDWEVDMESAYINYDFTSFSSRIGKMRAPLYMFSDYFDVGYAYPMIRPSQEMYENIIISSFTGVDFLIPIDIGESTLVFQPFGGNSEVKERDFPVGIGKILLDGLFGLNTHLYSDDFTYRVSYITSQTYNTAAPILNDQRTDFIVLGFQYDNGEMLILSEAIQATVSGDFSDIFSTYALVGYRFGSIMPYLSVSYNKTTDDDERTTGLETLNYETVAYSIGSRWDFAKNIALKVDVTYADFGNTNGGKVYNIDVNNQPIENDTFVYSATIDFIF